jgi:hypothetical protein
MQCCDVLEAALPSDHHLRLRLCAAPALASQRKLGGKHLFLPIHLRIHQDVMGPRYL